MDVNVRVGKHDSCDLVRVVSVSCRRKEMILDHFKAVLFIEMHPFQRLGKISTDSNHIMAVSDKDNGLFQTC